LEKGIFFEKKFTVDWSGWLEKWFKKIFKKE